ncbi:hypothetical protein TNCV_4616301 [Trichonephila clavipes]|nr:hypothetical protein TNCV_4616301 [Trichonephila clavipes]
MTRDRRPSFHTLRGNKVHDEHIHPEISLRHAGITGNELADTAARSATGPSERFPIPHSDLKACFRQKLQSLWQSNWDQQTENKLHHARSRSNCAIIKQPP